MGLNLEATIGLDSSGFQRGMERVSTQVRDSIKNFALGAIGVGTIEEAFRRTIDTADELVNSARQMNMTVEQVQLLRQAAKNAGQEFETVAKAIEKINEARAKALGGDFKTMAAFTALGVNKNDLLNKTGADLFTGQISAMVKSVSPEQIAAPLKEVLGKGGSDAVGILKTNFQDLQKQMQETGAIMSGEVAAKLKALSEEFSLVSRIITAQLAPALLAFAEWAYKATLKAGGTVATAAGVGGSLVGQAGWGGAAKDVAQTAVQDFSNFFSGKGFGLTPEQNAAIDKANGINSADVAKAAAAAADPWLKAQKELEALAARLANDVEHPKVADFNITAQNASRGEVHKQSEDSLVKVGNFLGSNLSSVYSAAAAYQAAQNTAANTKRTADYLQRAVDLLSAGFGPARPGGKGVSENFSSAAPEIPIF